MPRPPVARMKKLEIVKLSNWRCKHGESGLSHYNCYLREHPDTEKIGFLDIEASNLQADFGIVLTYAIKTHSTDEILQTTITAKDLRGYLNRGESKKEADARILTECIKDMAKYDRLVTYYGCVTPGHRILTSDLRWVPVETLVSGDAILAFDETAHEIGHRRHLRQATVIHNIPVEKDIYEIKLEDGTILEATEDHPWLVRRNNSKKGQYADISSYWQFRETNKLQHFNSKLPSLERIMPVWNTDTSHEAGYVGAFIDGEGHLSQAKRKDRDGEYLLSVTAVQNEGPILANYISKLNTLGFSSTRSNYDPSNRKCVAIRIGGGKQETIKFLGTIRPSKLQNLDINKLGTVQIYGEKVAIKSIRKIGKGTVCGLGTTSGTYIVEGFGSHNSVFDLPFLRTRALISGIPFPEYGAILHKDMYFAARGKLSLSSKRLENVCRVLFGKTEKTRIDSAHWTRALMGAPDALEYIADHCRKDVIELERVYDTMLNFGKNTDNSV